MKIESLTLVTSGQDNAHGGSACAASLQCSRTHNELLDSVL